MTTPDTKNKHRFSANVSEEEFKALSIFALGISDGDNVYTVTRTDVIRNLIRLLAEDDELSETLRERVLGEQVFVLVPPKAGDGRERHTKLPLGEDWTCPEPEWYRALKQRASVEKAVSR